LHFADSRFVTENMSIIVKVLL